MARRLFLAIPLPDRAAAEAVSSCRGIDTRCPRARWTRERNLHATVLFLGDVEDKQSEMLVQGLRDACRAAEPFTLVATGFVPGPPCGRASMLWIGYADSEAFSRLSRSVYGIAAPELGLPPFRGERAPHVTLARFRDGLPRPCADAAARVVYGASFGVTDCVLYESRLSGDGPTYIELERFPLGGAE